MRDACQEIRHHLQTIDSVETTCGQVSQVHTETCLNDKTIDISVLPALL